MEEPGERGGVGAEMPGVWEPRSVILKREAGLGFGRERVWWGNERQEVILVTAGEEACSLGKEAKVSPLF